MPPNQPPLDDKFCAIGALEGVVLLDKRILIASNGEEFPISLASHYRRWAESNPEAVAAARHHLVWPRTTKEGLHLTLTKSSLKRFPSPNPGTFKISGHVTNQRGSRDQVVFRVNRNIMPSGKSKAIFKTPEFKPHLLFLRGRLTPAFKYLNHHVSIVGALQGRDIAIRLVKHVGEIQETVIEVMGVKFQWPFASSRSSLMRLAELNGKKSPVVVFPGYRVKLKQLITAWREEIELMLKLAAPEEPREERDPETGEFIIDKATGQPVMTPPVANDARLQYQADRLRLVIKRIENFTKRLPDAELEMLLEDTALLVVLDSAKRSFISGLSFNKKDAGKPRQPSSKKASSELAKEEKMLTAEKPVTESKTKSGKAKIMDLIPEEMRDFAKDALRGMNDSGLQTKYGINSKVHLVWVNTLVNSGWLGKVPENLVEQIRSHQLLKAAGLKTNIRR